MQAHTAIIRLLDASGIDTIFSLMSEEIAPLSAELKRDWRDAIRVVKARHEQHAVGMADGYARATGDVGVCVVGRGPAIAQTGTALTTARKRGSKVLVVVPESARDDRHDVKGFAQEQFLRTTVGGTMRVGSETTLLTTLRDALRRVGGGDGPVAVQVPWDVLGGEVDDPDVSPVPSPGDTGPGGAVLTPDADAVDAAVERYLDSDATEPPIVLVGRGAVASGAKEAIEDLAERTSAYLATTLQAAGYFGDHPFSLGFVGTFGNSLANEYLAESDFVLAVGCSLNEHTTDRGRLLADVSHVVQIDADPLQIGRYQPVDLGIVGDAAETVAAIDDALARDGIDFSGRFRDDSVRRRLAETPPWDEREVPDAPDRMDPRDLIPALDRALPDDRLVVTDGGHFLNWVLDGIAIPHPDDYIWTLEFGSIGLGIPIGIGAACGRDAGTCVVFCGDAGLMMSLQSVETAARHDVPVVIVVVNDGALGSEYQQLKLSGEHEAAAVIDTPNLAALTADLGAESYAIDSLDEFGRIEERLGTAPEGPVVVECRVNPDVTHRSYYAMTDS